MTARTEAAGVAGALAVIRDSTECLREAVMADNVLDALATLQSRLLAADELREAAVEAHGRIADLALCGPLWNAIAAYDKAGLALRPSGDGVG